MSETKNNTTKAIDLKIVSQCLKLLCKVIDDPEAYQDADILCFGVDPENPESEIIRKAHVSI